MTSDGAQNERGNHWHLKKEVSVATLAMIVVNLILVVLFASRMDSRITALEAQNITDSRVARIEVMLDNETRARRDLEARTLVALEEIKGLLRELARDRSSIKPSYQELVWRGDV